MSINTLAIEALKKCIHEKRRIPELEKIIIEDGRFIFNYLKFVVKGRFPEVEETIKDSSEKSYLYATRYLKGRFYAGEEVISQDVAYATYYAIKVVKGPWPEAHQTILTAKGHYKNRYLKFLKKLKYDFYQIAEYLI